MHLLISNDVVTSKYRDTIRHAYNTPDMFAYLHKKYRWDQETANLIDWNGYDCALRGLRSEQKKRIIKLVHGWAFRGDTTDYHHPTCACGHLESVHHLTQCTFNSLHLHKFFQRLNLKLKQLRTHRPLRETFIALLRGVTPIPWGPFKDPLQRAIREQNKIGNNLMWHGLVTQTFADIQEEG